MSSAEVLNRLQQALGEIAPEGERFFAFAREDPPVLTLLVGWQARTEGR